MVDNKKKEDMNIVIVGHVDHGKSTLMGRLLADTDSLPQGKLEQVKETCRKNSKPFEYAFLLDALKDEQAQGITIDAARCFFQTKKRNYIILDAPGHIEFLKNMITGAARAEAAILVIDAEEGIQENSRRHGYLLSMLGIRQIAVAINKMDLVNYSQEVYERVKKEYIEFLRQIHIEPTVVLPVSAFEGDNIIAASDKMPWYQGTNILEVLDNFECEKEEEHQPFRMPVQDIYKFTENGDNRRIVAGTVETGSVRVGDEVVFAPSGKRSVVKSIEAFHAPERESVSAGTAIGFTLTEQIYIRRGEVMYKEGQIPPRTSNKIAANIFWLGKDPLVKNHNYFLKIGSEKVSVRLEKVINTMNSSNLSSEKKDFVAKNEVAECIFKTSRPIAFDLVENIAPTSRFVLVDNYEIRGGGIIIRDADTEKENDNIEEKATVHACSLGNEQIKLSSISRVTKAEREECFGHKAGVIFITGASEKARALAITLEKRFFEDGMKTYAMDLDYYGVEDLENFQTVGVSITLNQAETKKRLDTLLEVINHFNDAGLLVILSADETDLECVEYMKSFINCDTYVFGLNEELKEIPTEIDYEVTSKELSQQMEEIERYLSVEKYLR